MTEPPKINRRVILYALIVAASALACACASPQAENMVPHLARSTLSKPPTKTLRVVATTEVPPGPSYWARLVPTTNLAAGSKPLEENRITDSVFRDAVQNTLTESGLFKVVVSEGKADYELNATIFSQQIKEGSVTIGVRYKLVEMASGKQVSRLSFASQCGGGVMRIDSSGVAVGIDALSKADECAMRDNLSQLVKHLSGMSL